MFSLLTITVMLVDNLKVTKAINLNFENSRESSCLADLGIKSAETRL
jgi:hypothetical protein